MTKQLDQTLATAIAEQKLGERDLVAVVAEFVRELHPQRIRFIDVLPPAGSSAILGSTVWVELS
jgi:hypothetical protein